MRLEELKENAKKILELEPSGEYEHLSFKTRSGGGIANKASIEPEAIIHEDISFRYQTTANGSAYRGEIVINARPLKVTDAKGNYIYQTPAGTLFVFHYAGGSASCFDFGELRSPVME